MPPPSIFALNQPGPPGAPVVWALHGFTGGGRDFAPLAAALPQLGWRAPNLPGHAPDPSAPGAPADDCSPAASQRYLAGWPTPADGAPEILLGYSLGGRLALHWALAQPKRFAALVLVGASPGGMADPADRAARRAADEQLAREILAHGVPAFLRQWRRKPLIATQAQLPRAWQTAMRAHRRQLRAEGLAASLRGCGQGAFPSLWKKLPELRLPTLLVAGVQDQVYAAMAEKIRARCPRAEVLLVPAAGHMAHLENLPAFAAGLRNFLRGLEPGPGVGLQA